MTAQTVPTPKPEHSPHSSIRIAVLQAHDAPAYKVLRDASLLRAPEAFSTDYATAVTRPHFVYSARFGRPGMGPFYLGAFTTDGQLVGSLGVEREEALFKRHMAHVNAVMIDVNFEHQEIARQLLHACIALAEQMEGLEMLQLAVTATNARAVRLYERAGFRVCARVPRAIVVNGVGHDHLLMVHALPSCPELNFSAA
ncbi:N-acetyltransferase [Diaphorobacter sp.]|uniref:GNAT family N-acetyltransferase n=1 Tax=Diaphorobacter sp. TaxID=1934310 RepID=UPI0028B0DA4E|nr:N-acetyltransferase [Diaphorobacter sp.]